MPNNRFHRTTTKAWLVWSATMLFVGIFISRPIFGVFLGLGFASVFTAVVRPIVHGILAHTQGRPSDYFDQEPEGYRSSEPTWVHDHEADQRNVRHLAKAHYWQENPFISLPKIVAAMMLLLVLMTVVNLLGSGLITKGVLCSVFLMLMVTIAIWSIDVSKWQHEDSRIDPSATASDLENSIRQNGISKTIERHSRQQQ